MTAYFTIRWENGRVRMLDQRRLPQAVIYQDYDTPQGVAEAIRSMVIRGAPAIGAAAAYGMALAAQGAPAADMAALRLALESAAAVLKAARPTAVNLGWAVDRVLRKVAALQDPHALRQAVLDEALAIAEEDVLINRRMGQHGLSVVPQGAGIVHHCNTGALATVDYGTALGVVRAAHEAGRGIHVFVDETRPRLQGARLTAWELQQLGVPFTLIADGASGHFMRQGKVQLCLVGCDRVTANGDTANKIGTYNLALAAYAHGIPFYVVGPTSTIDHSLPDGGAIPIEERDPTEVTHVGAEQIAPPGVQAANPAFDVTPAQYITAIITENGIAYPPFRDNLSRLF
jgi:methylthioribose-1-phosphate isomerase